MRRLAKVVGGLALIAVVGAGIYFSVRAAYGAYGDYYYVTATMDRTGQQLLLESDVRVKGVEVGKVSDIQLVDRKAVVEMQIEKQYQIPKDVTAFVSLKTPLGAKYIDLRFPPEASGPYLADGDTIENSHVGPELEDLLADGVKVLEAFDPEDAGTIITELAEASRGRGDTIARGLENNAELSSLFADTTDPQLENFRNFSKIFAELEERGGDLNDLAYALNEGVPVYASEQAQAKMSASLSALVPFAEDFSDLLIYNREDWDRMMDGGYAVLNTVAARPEGLHDLVYGLYRYVYKLGGKIPDFFMVEDGSAGAGFINFIGGNDQKEEEKQICAAFPPEEREKIPACKERGL